MRGPVLLALAATVLLAACGTTTDLSDRAPGSAQRGDAASELTTGVPSGSGLSTAQDGASPGGSPRGSQAAAPSEATSTDPASGAAPAAGAARSAQDGQGVRAPSLGPGITTTTINLGVPYNSQRNQTAIALGAAGAAGSYDFRDVMNAVVAYANDHGRFAGRQLKPIYFDYASASDAQTGDGQACARWTQDNKVFALLGGTSQLNACAEKASAVAIRAGSGTSVTYAKFPHLVDPLAIRLDRLASVTVNGLAKARYFTGKLGLVTWDHPDYRYAMTQGYFPALKRLGVVPSDTVYISPPQSPGALPDMAAAVASFVTKFRSQGIDHVIIQDGPAGFCVNGCQTLVWMNQAKSQQWYPRYGQNFANAPGSSVMPSDQMDHALAVDSSDYTPAHDEGWRPNATRTRCFEIQREAGLPVQNDIDRAFATQVCDYVFFLQQVINKLTSLTADAFVEQVAALGTSFPTSSVYGSKFAPGRRDGGHLVRTSEYFDSCKCLKYLGPPFDPDR